MKKWGLALILRTLEACLVFYQYFSKENKFQMHYRCNVIKKLILITSIVINLMSLIYKVIFAETVLAEEGLKGVLVVY